MIGIFDIATKFNKPAWVCFGFFTQGGEALYYGFDKIGRAGNFDYLKKNAAFMDMTRQYADVEIIFSILSMHRNEDDARYSCMLKTDVYLPLPNRPVEKTRSFVRCLNDNELFVSQSAAANYYGITASTISNHLNGRRGYEKPNGLQFTWVHGIPQDNEPVIDARGMKITAGSIRVREI